MMKLEANYQCMVQNCCSIIVDPNEALSLQPVKVQHPQRNEFALWSRCTKAGRDKVKVFGAWLDADVAGRKAGQGNRAAGLVARAERGDQLTNQEKAEVHKRLYLQTSGGGGVRNSSTYKQAEAVV